MYVVLFLFTLCQPETAVYKLFSCNSLNYTVLFWQGEVAGLVDKHRSFEKIDISAICTPLDWDKIMHGAWIHLQGVVRYIHPSFQDK